MKNEIRVMLEDQYVVIVQAERKYRIDRNEWCVEKDGVSCPFTSAEKISVSQHDTTVEHTLSLIYERIIMKILTRKEVKKEDNCKNNTEIKNDEMLNKIHENNKLM